MAALCTVTLIALLWMSATPVAVRWGAWLLLGWWLPGLLLALGWRLPEADVIDVGLAGLGLGLGWLILGLLLVHWAPGPIDLWHLLLFYGGGALVLSAWLMQRPPALPVNAPRRAWVGLLLLLLAASLLRLPGLGYHEFHADEAVLLRQSRRAIEGEDDALANHTKGPGEIAVVASLYRSVGAVDEGLARLPFALMSVGSVLALAWCGRRLFAGLEPLSSEPDSAGADEDAGRDRTLYAHTAPPRIGLFNERAGLWAGLLLALNGFALGLSRIAQYQAAVLLLSALAVWAMWAFARRGQARWLALGAWCSAWGVVMHYEFALLAPALLLLLWQGRRMRAQPRAVDRTMVWAGVLGAALIAAAYVPAFFSDYFETTQGYLANRVGGAQLNVNLSFFVEMATFYNSTYFFAGLVLLMLGGAVWAWRRSRWVTLLLTLWWLPYFILYLLVVRYPGTHFYLLMQSWSLLAALPLALLPRLRARWLRGGLALLLGVWLAVSSQYLYLLFLRQTPEYLSNIDRERLAFYWAPFPTPLEPRFGFPIHAGWKTLGVLGEWGYLQETYAANDDNWAIRRWYLTAYDKRELDEAPDYIFEADRVLEVDRAFDDAEDAVEDEYTRVGEVRFGGEPRIAIRARQPLPVPYVTFDAEDFADAFRRDVAALPGVDLPGRRTIAADASLGDAIQLVRATAGGLTHAPGDTLHLALTWLPREELATDYKLFVHVAGADGRPVAQWDGFPGLNTARTSRWPVGEPFRDHVLLPLPADAPAGEYTLLAGLYDPATGDRLGDTAVQLGTLTVR